MKKTVIVLDTNIFVSALLGPGGSSRVIFRRCLEGQYQPLMGNALFTEYESLLNRGDIFKTCALNASEREEIFDAFLSVCRWVTIYFGWRPNLKDEADNHLIELAVAGGAEYVITKNTKDFLGTELLFPAFKVIKPEQFIDEVKPWQP